MDKQPQFPSSYCLRRLTGPNYFSFFFSNGTVSPIHCFWYLCNPSETPEFKDMNPLFCSSCVDRGLLRTQPSSEVLLGYAWDALISPDSGKLWDLSSWEWFHFSISILRFKIITPQSPNQTSLLLYASGSIPQLPWPCLHWPALLLFCDPQPFTRYEDEITPRQKLPTSLLPDADVPSYCMGWVSGFLPLGNEPRVLWQRNAVTTVTPVLRLLCLSWYTAFVGLAVLYRRVRKWCNCFRLLLQFPEHVQISFWPLFMQ